MNETLATELVRLARLVDEQQRTIILLQKETDVAKQYKLSEEKKLLQAQAPKDSLGDYQQDLRII